MSIPPTDRTPSPGVYAAITGSKIRISALRPNEFKDVQNAFQVTFELTVTSLMERSAEVVSSHEESGSAEAPASAELSALVKEINQKKVKLVFGTNWLPG
jgi:hypothetical protein